MRRINGMCADAEYLQDRGYSFSGAWFRVLFEPIEWIYWGFIEKTICRVLGHKWKDDSIALQNSGYISFHCERCLKDSSHNTLY